MEEARAVARLPHNPRGPVLEHLDRPCAWHAAEELLLRGALCIGVLVACLALKVRAPISGVLTIARVASRAGDCRGTRIPWGSRRYAAAATAAPARSDAWVACWWYGSHSGSSRGPGGRAPQTRTVGLRGRRATHSALRRCGALFAAKGPTAVARRAHHLVSEPG